MSVRDVTGSPPDLEERYYEKHEEVMLESERQLDDDKCIYGCLVKDGHYYCKATHERCKHGLFDKPWSLTRRR